MKKKHIFWLTASLFFIVSIPYLFSDMWMDEIISFWDFWHLPSILDVFLSYPVANNHILFSAILWIWCGVMGAYQSSEPLLRIPCLIFGIFTLFAIARWAERRSPRTCVLLVFTMTFSPILLPFFFQLRGYSLSILLSTIATIGCLDMAKGETKSGMKLWIPCALLLPLVIPGNILLTVAHIFFMLVFWTFQRHFSTRWHHVVFMGIVAIFSMSPYLLIWEQFIHVMRSPLGWESGLCAIGNLLLALALHLLIPGLFFWAYFLRGMQNFLRRMVSQLRDKRFRRAVEAAKKPAKRDSGRNADDFSESGLWKEPEAFLSYVSLGMILVSMASRHPAPYPRLFLVFFPLFTICLCGLLDRLWEFSLRNVNADLANEHSDSSANENAHFDSSANGNERSDSSANANSGFADIKKPEYPEISWKCFLKWACIFVTSYLFWNACTTFTTNSRINQYPQNLLEQFYQARQDASFVSKWLHGIEREKERESVFPQKSRFWILCSFHQWIPFRHYWYLEGGDPERAIPCVGVPQAWKKPIPNSFTNAIQKGHFSSIVIVACSEEEARNVLQGFLREKKFHLRFWGGRGIYKIFQIEEL